MPAGHPKAAPLRLGRFCTAPQRRKTDGPRALPHHLALNAESAFYLPVLEPGSRQRLDALLICFIQDVRLPTSSLMGPCNVRARSLTDVVKLTGFGVHSAGTDLREPTQ